ncbi:MAG: gatB [Chitinophagaceae bacterium]|nr:gatB [Chitinophagaceae bacterium]
MADIKDKYEAVIGLEVHAQLLTKSKLFSGDSISFGAEPNTQISAITLAHPGTLPRLNKKAVELAVKLGLSCNCKINEYNAFARKHYLYPDLPKGYQVTQHMHPICTGGFVPVRLHGEEKSIPIHHIHMEEDAGKSIHDLDEDYSYLDYNRAGTPLVEIVTEPAMHSAEEAYQFLTELRRLVRWIEVCDGNMEEGSLRCDANVSIRLKGETQLGTKVEVKNLNSIRNVKRAIEYEIERLIELKETDQPIIQQTRSFEASSETTFAIREKEEAKDYRYLTEPDIPPFFIEEEYVNGIKKALPLTPLETEKILQAEYALTSYDAAQIAADKPTADYFFSVTSFTQNYKAIVNWINGPLKKWGNEELISVEKIISPVSLAELIDLVAADKVNFSLASSKIFPELVKDRNKTALEVAEELNLLQTNNTNELDEWTDLVINKMPDKVQEYKKGKKGLLGLFVGEVKKISKGKADPAAVTTLLQKKLES